MLDRDATGTHIPASNVLAPATRAGRSDRLSSVVLLFFLFAALCLKFSFWFRFPVNQDEFSYLAKVYVHARGDLAMVFQTVHVHLFSWLPAISENEVTQVMAARVVMSALFLSTCACLLLLGRHLFGLPGALFSVLCYVSLLATQYNGGSFRSDTPAAFFAMVAVYLFVVGGRSGAANILAGISIALAFLFTIKAAIYLALFLPLSLIRLWASRCSRASLKHTGFFGVAFAAGLTVAYVLHTATLAASSPQPPEVFLGGAASTFLTIGRLFPGAKYFLATLLSDRVIWLLLALGFFLSLLELRGQGQHWNARPVYALVMSMPLLSLLFYRNAYPYYYAFMMPPVTLLCGYAYHRLTATVRRQKPWLCTAVAVVLAALVFQNDILYLPFFSGRATRIAAAQRGLLAEIHRMFPVPVPYLDGCSMVASYPQVGFFMSTAGMKGYLRTGRPNLKDVLAGAKPRFLLADVPHLDLAGNKPPASSAGLSLREEDWTALRAYFIHHWGPVWVAGKQFDGRSENLREDFEIVTPGVYTVEADTDVRIDGRRFRPGDATQLPAGTHTIEAEGPTGTIRLRWGDHLYCPGQEPAAEPLFLGIFG